MIKLSQDMVVATIQIILIRRVLERKYGFPMSQTITISSELLRKILCILDSKWLAFEMSKPEFVPWDIQQMIYAKI